MVLGTSDVGSRVFTPRRVPAARARAVAPAVPTSSSAADPILAVSASETAGGAAIEPAGETELDVGSAASPAKPGRKGRAPAPAASADQVELSFGEHETCGTFEKTDRNLFEGQDLDVPTYLRQGLKLHL
jgi:cell division protein FtsZ